MASKEKKSGGDFVLESRHLVGLFFLLVVIFGVVFTLGYLLGRSQYDSSLRSAVAKPVDVKQVPPLDAPAPSSPAPLSKEKSETEGKPGPEKSNWDFYHSADPKTTQDHLQPPAKTVTAAKPAATPKILMAPAKIAAPAKASTPLNAPLIPKGAIMLQVAAVSTEGDALALAQALQQKKFPAFVITPGADKFYRVQVGPYADSQSATIARKELEAKGFKSIVKK